LHLGDHLVLLLQPDPQHQTTVTYTIVGVLSFAYPIDSAYASQSSLSSHLGLASDDLLPSLTYYATLRPGASPATLAHDLGVISNSRLDAQSLDTYLPPSVKQLSSLGIIFGGVLMLIAAISILNGLMLATRERFHEIGIMKAVGLTPRQVIQTLTLNAVALGGLAVAIGLPLGLWIATTGMQSGAGSVGISSYPVGVDNVALIILIPVTLCVAALGAFLPAWWASRVPASVALRYE
jgi:putative ABC transport system permease protein